MAEKAIEVQGARENPALKVVPIQKIFEDMRDAFDAIARRAYSIFDSGGRPFGHDLEHWFKAESELLYPLQVDLVESEDLFKIQAEVPGFEPKDLEISVEPTRLTIAGKRETAKEEKTKKIVYSERRADQIFRTLELPAEVDTQKVTARLKNGVLELDLPKAVAAKKVRVEAKAA